MRVLATLILSCALIGCATEPAAWTPVTAVHPTLVRPLDGGLAADSRRDGDMGRSGPPVIFSEDVWIRDRERRWTTNGRVRENSSRSVWTLRRTGVTNPQRP